MAQTDHPTSKGQVWFCTPGLPSDIIIEVEDMTFHLHKFPLMSKSRKLHEMITEQETKSSSSKIQKLTERDKDGEGDEEMEEEEDEENEEDRRLFEFPLMSKSRILHEMITEQETKASSSKIQKLTERDKDGEGDEEIEEEEDEENEEDQQCCISLPDFPGGSETFETAAKFCYGVKIEPSASNVAPLRCAGEYLEMTEEYSEDNLISKTERFLSQTVLKSIKDSIRTLNSCKNILPLAETLGIVQRCIDAFAVRASAADPSLFGWPVNDSAGNGVEENTRRKGANRGGGMDSWFEELGHLSLPLFKRLIIAMKARDLSSEVIESCLMYYAKKYIPGISRSKDVETSLNDYLKALSILERLVEPDSRRIAELNFRICLCLEIGSKTQEAIPYCQKALSTCKSRLQRLTDEIKLLSESTERAATTSVDQIARQSSSTSQSDSVSAKEAEVETLTGLSTELEKKLEDLQQCMSNPSSILSDILGMVSAKARSMEKADASAAVSSSQMGAATSGSGGFDSPTISPAHTNGAAGVTHLGVVGRGVKRVLLNPTTESSPAKKPASEQPSNNGGDGSAS